MKKTWWIVGIILVLGVAGFFAYRAYAAQRQTSTAAVNTATVTRGSITQDLSAAGTVRTGQSAQINWQTSGTVAQVLVKIGDKVQAGQELATLDPTSLSPAMLNAQQTLINAQKALDDLLNSKTTEAQAAQAVLDAQTALDNLKQTAANDLANAQVTLATAQQALLTAQAKANGKQLPNSTNPLVIEKAYSDYLLAKKTYVKAYNEFQKFVNRPLTDKQRYAALSALISAEQKMNTDLQTYNWLSGKPTKLDVAQANADLAQAQANVDQAQATYNSLKGGPTSSAVTLAEAKLADAQRAYDRVKNGPSAEDIAAAQAAVNAAQATLNQQHLVAPFAGTITDINILPGDQVGSSASNSSTSSSNTPAIQLDNVDSMFTDVQVSEVDVNNLKVGQQATFTFDAIPNQSYTGKVTEIGISGSSAQGVVNYPVTLQIDNPDAAIKPGMTATVAIAIAQHDDVLVVPNSAIRSSGGQRNVTVLFEGQQFTIPVTVGLTNGTQSEVTSSQLKEGDEVVLNTTTTTNTNRSGGFGGPGGGAFFVRPGG